MKNLIKFLRNEFKKNFNFDYIVKACFLFFIYYLTGKLGLTLNPVSDFATLFWMPTGISLAYLFLNGKKFWPVVFLAASYVNLTNGAPPFIALSIGAGNALEALVGVYLLKRVNFSPSFKRLSDSLNLIFYAGIVSTFISATIGTLSLSLGGILSFSFTSTLMAWWVGDMLSNFIVAPFILSWGHNPKLNLTPNKISEGVLLAIFILLTCTLVFTGVLGIFFKNAPFAYMIFPPLILVALRFKPRETATAIFVTTVIATWSTYNGYGPFAVATAEGNLIFLQGFIATTAITFLVLASAMAERRNLKNVKEEFIALATHELKTPITSIKVYAELMHKSLVLSKDFKNGEIAGRMKNQIDKLSKLINDLLDIEKIDEQRLRIEQSYFDFNELVLETVDQMQTITDNNRIVSKLDRTKTLFADRDRIGQVIINLISNAIKYSPKETKVKITSKMQDKKMVFCVEDKGIGIPRSELNKAFEKTFRGSGKETYPGLGLGLYISREIIKRHQGKIWAKSIKDKGSTFCFSIPIREYKNE